MRGLRCTPAKNAWSPNATKMSPMQRKAHLENVPSKKVQRKGAEGMKALHKSWRLLFHDLLLVTAVLGTVGIALKFTVYFDRWVWFPWFPNVLDSVFLLCALAVVFYEGWRRAGDRV
jgi:hypothetical protein